MDLSVLYLLLKIGSDTKCKQIYNVIIVLHVRGIECFHDRIIDLSQNKLRRLTISLNYLKHLSRPPA